MIARGLLLATAVTAALPAFAQEGDDTRRWRIGLGPQLVPSYPGADRTSVRPLIDIDRVRGDAPFAFEAPDESAGFPLLRDDRFSFGPAVGFEGRRRSRDAGGVGRVGRTVELGGFVQVQPIEPLRLRAELRQGIGGHEGLVANLGADYLLRDADRWLFSAGPRVTLANRRYHRAYFGVTPDGAARSGLPVYDVDGGVQAVGGTVGLLRQFSPRWGMFGYAKYDRLTGDAARSPIVRSFGDRNQLSAGIALTYSFTTGRR
ncbi:MipA/OmpV family protein [Sphingomonas sp. ac-8]|uniref:MipA/OmpV family protein n=1 Tax=Sphingomonas sp. ac-8 TaxID=3242977 RepID=UPI003A7FF1C6